MSRNRESGRRGGAADRGEAAARGAAQREIARQLGRRIREERQRLGLTQEQLAERSGLSANYIAHLERGTRGASLDTLVRVADVVDRPVGALFAGGPVDGPRPPLPRELERLVAQLRGLPPAQVALVEVLVEAVREWGREGGTRKGS